MQAKVTIQAMEEDLWFSDNDIPFSILARLPTRNLLEMKCVSKGWKRLISEPCFIKEKLKTKEPVSGFFFQERFQWCDEDINSISFIKNSEKDMPGGIDIIRSVFNFLPEDAVLLAATNGLICCRSSLPCLQPILYVCNPSNKEWVTLHCPGVDKLTSLGLAFEPVEDSIDKETNFKLVRVCQTVNEIDDDTDDDIDYSFSTFSFELYSSKTRIWTKLKETLNCEHNLFKNKGICVRGRALFWLTNGDKILMFDAEGNVARFISIPVPLIGLPEMCIGESEEKLHYVLISKEGILVWELDDSVEFDWALKYFVDLDEMEKENYGFLCNARERVASRMSIETSAYIDPLAYKDGILLLRVSAKIYIYNFDTGKMKELCNVSALGPNSMCTPIVFPYSLSLVPFAWP